MALSRYEEMVFRELQAIAGDLNQVSENITRDHDERLKEAEAMAKERERGKGGFPALPMRCLDKIGLAKDLRFIQDRLSLLIAYASPEPHIPQVGKCIILC